MCPRFNAILRSLVRSAPNTDRFTTTITKCNVAPSSISRPSISFSTCILPRVRQSCVFLMVVSIGGSCSLRFIDQFFSRTKICHTPRIPAWFNTACERWCCNTELALEIPYCHSVMEGLDENLLLHEERRTRKLQAIDEIMAFI